MVSAEVIGPTGMGRSRRKTSRSTQRSSRTRVDNASTWSFEKTTSEKTTVSRKSIGGGAGIAVAVAAASLAPSIAQGNTEMSEQALQN
jgi:hypothetical protein